MTVLYNNLTTGPDGTNITNTNSGLNDDDLFDTYNNPGTSGRILQYKSADGLNRPTAEFVMRAETAGTSGAQYVGYTTSFGTQSQYWVRFYAYFTVLPDNFLSPSLFESLLISGVSYRANLGVLTTGGARKLFTETPSGSTYIATTNNIVQGAWFRVEARFQLSTTTGNGEVRYYEDADSDIPTETLSFSSWNLGGSTADMYMWGYPRADVNLETLYMSGLAISNEDWLGPAPYRAGKGVPGILSTPIAVSDDAR
jgi:hypothetical protein